MIWNKHKNLEGSHAILSASKSEWIEKDEEELIESITNSYSPAIGTLLHSYAADRIFYRERMRKTDVHGVKFDLLRNRIPEFAIDLSSIFPTLMSYVNDAIGYQLDPEVVLYYSDRCYGTADAIQVDGDILRIHDLKTGTRPAKMRQLLIYAALFYLEYGVKPDDMRSELRIYQTNEILVYEPESAEIREVMKKIVEKDRVVLQKFK